MREIIDTACFAPQIIPYHIPFADMLANGDTSLPVSKIINGASRCGYDIRSASR